MNQPSTFYIVGANQVQEGQILNTVPNPKSLQKIIQVNFTLKVEPSIRLHTTHLSSHHFSALLDTHTHALGKFWTVNANATAGLKSPAKTGAEDSALCGRFGIWSFIGGRVGLGLILYIFIYIYIFFLCLSKIVSWSSESFISLCAWWATASLPCSEGN